MRPIAFAPVFFAIIVLACNGGGVTPPDDDDSIGDDDTEHPRLDLARGQCAIGPGHEVTITAPWNVEGYADACSSDSHCGNDLRCFARSPDVVSGQCYPDVCRTDDDCDPDVRCYTHDPTVTTGRCSGGLHQGAPCDTQYVVANAGEAILNSVDECNDSYWHGACVWEDHFTFLCPNGVCDGNPFCPDNLSCAMSSWCGCLDGTVCVGEGAGASCHAMPDNPLIDIMPGLWGTPGSPYAEPKSVTVDPTDPACARGLSDDYPAQDIGDACVRINHGSGGRYVLDNTALHFQSWDSSWGIGIVLEDGWRIEIFQNLAEPNLPSSSNDPYTLIRIGDFAE